MKIPHCDSAIWRIIKNKKVLNKNLTKTKIKLKIYITAQKEIDS